MKLTQTILLAFALSFLSFSAHATHVIGSDISYTFISDSVYDFTFTFYRDCAGTPFADPSPLTGIKCTQTGADVGLRLQRQSIKNITIRCGSDTVSCATPNTRSGAGVEEHVYTARVDFRASAFQKLLGCQDLVAYTGQCCRTSAVTTGSANSNFYNTLAFSLDFNHQNSSPAFATEPRTVFCCNQPSYLSFGATDTDGDSLSYALVAPLTAMGSTISYNASYSADWPMDAFDPRGDKKANPKATPPIGIYLSPTTGDFILTPVNCAQVAPVAVQVTEWRKDNSGTYVKIGEVRRELILSTKMCQNIPPSFKLTKTRYELCEGEAFQLDFESSDRAFVPPPPLKALPADSTVVRWDRSIPGATFTILSDTAKHQVGRLHYTPKMGDHQSSPYTVHVTATDLNCELSLQTRIEVTLDVLAVPEADLGSDTIVSKPFNLTLQTNANPTYNYLWSTGDTTPQIRVADYGTYVVQVFNACDTIFDTIEVSQNSSVRPLGMGQWSIIPNPVKHSFKVTGSTEIQSIQLHDALGRVVPIHWEGVAFGAAEVIPAEQLTPGSYLCIIQTPLGKLTKRLVVHP